MNEEYLNVFESYLKIEKRYSEHTVLAYKTDLTQFEFFLSKGGDCLNFLEVDENHIRSWIIDMLETGISARTVNRKISCLKRFYKFLEREELIQKNPTQFVVSPKMQKRLPDFVEQQELNELLDSKDVFDENFEGRRDKLVIELLYLAGLRLSELINIQLKDIDQQRNVITVLGKRKKYRQIPYPKSLQNEINKYLQQREQVDITGSFYFFLTKKGEKLYDKLVYRVVSKFLGRLSTAHKTSPHVLRHTFATHMLNNGAELNTIKEILGHANLAATQVYTHNSFEKLRNIYKQAHPRA